MYVLISTSPEFCQEILTMQKQNKKVESYVLCRLFMFWFLPPLNFVRKFLRSKKKKVGSYVLCRLCMFWCLTSLNVVRKFLRWKKRKRLVPMYYVGCVCFDVYLPWILSGNSSPCTSCARSSWPSRSTTTSVSGSQTLGFGCVASLTSLWPTSLSIYV